MKDVMTYTIPGIPTPLLRARPSFKTNTIYNSQKNYQVTMRLGLQDQHNDKPLFVGPLLVDITFYVPITKTNNKKNNIKPRRLVLYSTRYR